VHDCHRPEICGVPVDPVNLDDAVHYAMSAVEARSFLQICTVNLDFLINARHDSTVRSVLKSSQLNLADGTPILWLGRLLGHNVPARVAGADFVPTLVEAAANRGASVFFLGGENGVAMDAANRLKARHPALDVAGVYQPPRATLEEMDDDEIVRRVREARPDILLVALGHPKQDKWIHAQRHRLPTSVAVGVGCTFDLIAGRRSRAPSWMQKRGLEWFYRLVHEPRRLLRRYATDLWWLVVIFVPATLYHRLLRKRG
jgi:N-acetylglucosaminyldiphosphoundecaprenol N-acetyl-beta-D-mannosaminyltransferase